MDVQAKGLKTVQWQDSESENFETQPPRSGAAFNSRRRSEEGG